MSQTDSVVRCAGCNVPITTGPNGNATPRRNPLGIHGIESQTYPDIDGNFDLLCPNCIRRPRI